MSISGPFIKEESSVGSGFRYRKQQQIYRQTRPWVNPLPYRVFTSSGRGEGDGFWGTVNASNSGQIDFTRLDRIAYDRLHKKSLERANLALTLLDTSKSVTMIRQRLTSLVGAVRELKRGNIPGVLRRLVGNQSQLSSSRIREIRRITTKDPASAWLEFTFGWVPLCQDIYDSVQVLQRDFGSLKVKGSFKESFPETKLLFWSDGSLSQRDSYGYSAKVTSGFEIKVTNPNLLLANQLGLVNPAFVVWDAVPFSFVVDWFLPVGKFLASFSNDVGMEQIRPYTSRKVVISNFVQERSDQFGQPLEFKNSGEFSSFYRETRTLARPDLLSRARLPGVSPWLLATSAALLRQNLSALVPRK